MSELKPCPFEHVVQCGVKLMKRKSHPHAGTHYFVKCRDCGIEGILSYNKKESIKLWNTRPIDPRIAELEAVRDSLLFSVHELLETQSDDDFEGSPLEKLTSVAIKRAEATKGKVG